MTRQTFLLAAPEALLARPLAAATTRPKLLIVAAHPDDEYAFAATTYRLTRELGWAADHVVITNGEAGYRYSALAEAVYGVGLTAEREGRSRLPAIRKRETLAAGKVLGIRRHYFLDQRDSGFTTDAASAPTSNWDYGTVRSFLTGLLHREHYDAVFTLLPTAETHGHHRAATLLTLEAAATLPEDFRPLLLGSDPCAANAQTELFRGMPGSAALAHPRRAARLRLRPRCPFWVSQCPQLPNRRQLVHRRTQVAGPVSNRFGQAPVGAVLAV